MVSENQTAILISKSGVLPKPKSKVQIKSSQKKEENKAIWF